MNFKKLLNPLLLLCTAFIWGVAFVAQKNGSDSVEPFLFTSLRSFLGGVVLLPIIGIMGKKAPQPTVANPQKKDLFVGGALCGTALFAATAFQQIGLTEGTNAGKSGFITALYIVLVPLFGIFLKKRVTAKMWLSVAIAAVGLYLLCVDLKSGFSVQKSDIWVMACAVVFSVHILVIDRFSLRVECIKMSCIQFFVCGILSLISALVFNESFSLAAIGEAAIPLLYLGIMSSGVAYTLQIVAQRGTEPTVASMIMSLESVFAVLAGVMFGEKMSAAEIVGCVVMFAAIILSQLPEKEKCR